MPMLVARIAFTVILSVMSIAAASHALLNKRDPRAAFGWIAVCLLFPFAGPILYVLFGVNRVNTRARALDDRRQNVQPTAGEHAVDHDHVAAEYSELARISDAVSRRPLVGGNRIDVLRDGEEAYPRMLDAIRAAERTVVLASYIFDTDETGCAFVDALADAHDRGVDVRVLLDGLGQWYSWPHAARLLRHRGVPAARFLPPRLIPPAFHVNLRNHRKILVVDGATAFTGGMNIGDRHRTTLETNREPISDVHFRLRGPVVRQIEEVFHEDWAFVTGQVPPDPDPPPPPEGPSICRTVVDGPNDDINKLATILVAAFSAATERIDIMTPYFLPPREMVSSLQSAALRGVDVGIVLPARNNLPFVHWATRNMLWELLKYGAKVYYQPPPFSHTKAISVDRHYVQFGSANLDPRSLRLNFEIAVEVYDREFGAPLTSHFDEVRAKSRQVTLEELDGRPLPVRARDAICWLFSPYL
jgi:cardiolipin synthase